MSALAGRLVLVAGASRGLGRAVALASARAGAQLVLVARTRGALEELDDAIRATGAPPATLAVVDLCQGGEVDALGAALFARFGRLDAMVATAARLGTLSPVAQLDPADLAATLALNIAAQQRLIRSMDPLLRAAPAARAVFVTCDAARAGSAYWGGYGASKAALEALITAYAAEQRLSTLQVALVDPGPLATKLRGRAFPGERPGDQPDPQAAGEAIAGLLALDRLPPELRIALA